MPRLSVIVPALNEEANLAGAVESVIDSGIPLADLEILIFNDGSTDRTGKIADELAARFPQVKAIHNEGNRGFGYNYRTGVKKATGDFVIMIPGDNEIQASSVRALISQVGLADLTLSYPTNPGIRPKMRQWLSKGFTGLVNLLFGLRIQYFNGINILRRDILVKVPMSTNSFAYMAEIIVYLIRAGARYQEVPFQIQTKKDGGSKALVLGNLVRVVALLVRLWWKVVVLKDNPVNRKNEN